MVHSWLKETGFDNLDRWYLCRGAIFRAINICVCGSTKHFLYTLPTFTVRPGGRALPSLRASPRQMIVICHEAVALGSLSWPCPCPQYTYAQDFTHSGLPPLPDAESAEFQSPIFFGTPLVRSTFQHVHTRFFSQPVLMSEWCLDGSVCSAGSS